jgi:hypothetical protein
MRQGLSDQVRSVAEEEFIYPAIRSGKERFSVAVRDLMAKLQTKGFPARNWPQVCTAIQAEKFLRANGLKIESVEGPPSKICTTVVVRYRVAADGGRQNATRLQKASSSAGSDAMSTEDPSARAFRLTGKLRGLLKDEFAEYGGGEAFLRWVRGYDEEDAV